MGRNPETSEAVRARARKARLPDPALRVADFIEASGHHVPREKAGHTTAPFPCVKSTEKALATRAVPHTRPLTREGTEIEHNSGAMCREMAAA